MQNDALHILLAEEDAKIRSFFREAFEGIKVRTILNTVTDCFQLIDYLNKDRLKKPDILFLKVNLPLRGGMHCLMKIRTDPGLKDLIIAIYSDSGSDKTLEEAFVKGANIFIKKPDEFYMLRNALVQVINTYWQYHTSGLRKDNFLLNISN
jgi:CheY-like chemotaxis protein